MKLLRNTRSTIIKNEHGENVPPSKITEIVLVRCNIVNSEYQQDSKFSNTSAPNKSFGQL